MDKDVDLINNIKNNVDANNSLMELINRHSGIFFSMVNSYIPDNTKLINKVDIINDKNYYIYQAALKYDEERESKFSTFLGNETKWMCLNLYNKLKGKSYVNYEDCDYIDLENHNSEVNKLVKKDLLDKVIGLAKRHPDKRVATIFKMRYIDGYKNGLMPWKPISEKLTLSIQGCINIHDGAIRNFKNKLINEENRYVK